MSSPDHRFRSCLPIQGLDFGLYTCAGEYTCVGKRPGSKGHSDKDAAVFAEWGVDWVKQDNCNTNGMGKPEDYYKLMSKALNSTGRPMAFAMCEWGKDDPWKWGNEIAQSWRMSGDHTGVWDSTKQIVRASGIGQDDRRPSDRRLLSSCRLRSRRSVGYRQSGPRSPRSDGYRGQDRRVLEYRWPACSRASPG